MAEGRYALAILEQIDRRVGRIEENMTRVSMELITARNESTTGKHDRAELRMLVQSFIADREEYAQRLQRLEDIVLSIRQEKDIADAKPHERWQRIQNSAIVIALILIVFLLAAVVYALIDGGQSLPFAALIGWEAWRLSGQVK